MLKLMSRDVGCKNPMADRPAARLMFWRDDLLTLFSAEHFMGMPARAPHRPWTEEEFYAARDDAPPGERWELVDGEVLVTPAPHWVHQRIIGRLFELITPYVRLQCLGETFLSPLDVKLEPGLVLQPDLLVVPAGELKRRSDIVRHLPARDRGCLAELGTSRPRP